MKLLRFFFLFSLLVSTSSCIESTKQWFGKAKKRLLILETNPSNAEVSFYNVDSKKFEVLGRTPIEIDIDEIVKINKSPKAISLMVSKKGYVKENLLAPLRGYSHLYYTVNMDAVKWWVDPNDENASYIVHYLGTSVREVYSLIRIKQLDVAMGQVDKLLDQFPGIPIFHDIKGSIYLLKGDKQKAIAEYQRSLQLRPDNPDTLKKLMDLKVAVPFTKGSKKKL
jgi:tetratricopeptide (TPR) repeat protein